MEQNTIDPALEVKREIEQQIKKRKKYIGMDFSLAHFFLWVSILASFTSSILIAAGVNWDRIVVAIIAGIPGLVILIEKSFDFAKRASWGALYKVELEQLKYDLIFERVEPYDVSKRLVEIEAKYEIEFSKIGFFAKKKPIDQSA